MSDIPNAEKDPRRAQKTAGFVVLMAAVFGAFWWLSTLKGPPMMPPDETHQVALQKRDDPGCLRCHALDEKMAQGTPAKVLSVNHPPPRPKKLTPRMNDAGVLETPPGPLWECIKCHAPRS